MEELDNGKWHFVEKDWEETVSYRCPCCKFKTLHGRNHYELCSVCFWQDDGQDDHDTDVIRGGPNSSLSLTQARANFQEFGACEEDMIPNGRKPTPEEM